MYREEAIKELKILKEEYWDDDGYGHETKQYDDTMLALDMAMKALEQEPTSEWQQDHAILKAHSDGANEVIDQIKEAREEVKAYCEGATDEKQEIAFNACLMILDKLIAEVEG